MTTERISLDARDIERRRVEETMFKFNGYTVSPVDGELGASVSTFADGSSTRWVPIEAREALAFYAIAVAEA